ncbi:hypothetical protein KUTeg_005269 [Tegillarca granosa]|uniref:Uncharacterized protein n=1 Tax=Tegillarca granosa TaxID=220873 RepID=A0ABQ9FM62_TEGGR|nr:hypothetical protein KUTeg_005269 [Tegillarca granosa]
MENLFLSILIILLSDFTIVYPLDNFNDNSARIDFQTDRRYYDVVNPVFYHNRKKRDTTLHKGQHLESVTLYFKAFSKKFSLDLKWNNFLNL